ETKYIMLLLVFVLFFFSSRRRHTRFSRDWSSDVCSSDLPGLTSVYPWEGKIETAQEHLLLMKTETAAFEALEVFVREKHPYELPEVIAVPVLRGSTAYLDWISEWLHRKS